MGSPVLSSYSLVKLAEMTHLGLKVTGRRTAQKYRRSDPVTRRRAKRVPSTGRPSFFPPRFTIPARIHPHRATSLHEPNSPHPQTSSNDLKAHDDSRMQDKNKTPSPFFNKRSDPLSAEYLSASEQTCVS